MFTLNQLKSALAPLRKKSQREKKVQIHSLEITFRFPSAAEEMEIAKRYRNASPVDQNGDSVASITEMSYMMQVYSLAALIVQVGDQDLRDIQEIDTGDKTESGLPITQSKEDALRGVLATLDQDTLANLMGLYLDFSQEVRNDIRQTLVLTPIDDLSEVDRLKNELAQAEGRLAQKQILTREQNPNLVVAERAVKAKMAEGFVPASVKPPVRDELEVDEDLEDLAAANPMYGAVMPQARHSSIGDVESAQKSRRPVVSGLTED